jgi:uncharacterized MAPEG superfamily protein
MTLAEWCILVAIVLPYLWVGVAKFSRGGAGRYDNRAPRDYLSRVQGRAARANWAQLNAWEALAPFIAAVLIAEKAGVAQGVVDGLAIGFIVARVLHALFYLADQAVLRSAAWSVGFGIVIALFVLAARA